MTIIKHLITAILCLIIGFMIGFYKSTPYKTFLIKYYAENYYLEIRHKDYYKKITENYEKDFEALSKALFSNKYEGANY